MILILFLPWFFRFSLLRNSIYPSTVVSYEPKEPFQQNSVAANLSEQFLLKKEKEGKTQTKNKSKKHPILAGKLGFQ